jgi:hypothetical protein
MQNFAVGRKLGVVDEHTSLSYQKYNGLVLTVQRRAASGVSITGNYTLSKCLGLPTAGGGTPNVGTGYVDPNNPDYDYGPCDSDRRHNFNVSATAQSPRFENTALRIIASDWRLSGIFRAYSGSPFSVTVTTDPAGTGLAGQRANVAGDPYGAGTLTNFLDPTAFTIPAAGTLGNAGRNAFNGPGSHFLDLSLVRAFRFAGTQRIEARVESFNALNWFQWNNPQSSRNNVLFGRITSAGDPRIMQFALKYSF